MNKSFFQGLFTISTSIDLKNCDNLNKPISKCFHKWWLRWYFLVDNSKNLYYSLEYSKFSTVLECFAESFAAIYTDFVVTKTVEINAVLYQHNYILTGSRQDKVTKALSDWKQVQPWMKPSQTAQQDGNDTTILSHHHYILLSSKGNGPVAHGSTQ